MIGYLSGKIIQKEKENIIIFTDSGVGYSVRVDLGFKYKEGDSVSLFIHTLVKESEISLWGFEKREEILLFQELLTVRGVGPRIARLLISEGVKNVKNAIKSNNPNLLKITGVGIKIAQRIVLDLRSKYSKEVDLDFIEDQEKFIELKNALKSLGFAQKEINEVIRKISPQEFKNQSLESIIKICLKSIQNDS